MFEVREATEPETQAWRDGWAARLRERYAARYRDPGAVAQEVERNLTALAGAGGAVYTVEIGGALAGHLALGGTVARRPGDRRLHDLWLAPQQRGRGLARPLAAWARRRATEAGGRSMSVALAPGEVAGEALFGAYPLRAQQMVKDVTVGVTPPAGIVGRPMTEAEFAAWRDGQIAEHAAELADSGSVSAADAHERAVASIAELLPGGVPADSDSFRCVVHDGQVVGTIWLRHGFLPGTGYVFGVDVRPAYRGRGFGRAAMLVGERLTADAGEAQLALNVYGHNTVAQRLYDSLGYQVVERYHAAEL
ncbi:GNAT family N-acetyltransferase [Catellatospora bangladeshensis]|uniref:N-acetyltransferase n=1 Tax=Catellatospora bangladeshensis TaxID=310355 RepID=A0A8J3JCI3_9ACTN|nr:GNAT family N-acetyltransferase [Catellatospora bangladeshensis]GIF81801.1 N-acetyltransferase [Catellatospora bangladeshensis]